MTIDEARILKRLIREKIDVKGKCKMFSVALGKVDNCDCPLCQVDEMDLFRLWEEVRYLTTAKFNGLEQRRAIEEAVPKWLCYQCGTPLIGWDTKVDEKYHIYCPNGTCGIHTHQLSTPLLAQKEYECMRKRYIERTFSIAL